MAPKSATEEHSGEFKTLVEKGQLFKLGEGIQGAGPQVCIWGLATQYHMTMVIILPSPLPSASSPLTPLTNIKITPR